MACVAWCNNQCMSEKHESPKGKTPRPPAWKSKSLIVAVAVMLLGLGLWGYAAATRPKVAPVVPAAGHGRAVPGVVQGLASDPQAAGGGQGTAPTTEPEARLIDKASPAVARFGGCFVVAFCVGYAFKKFIKVTAILTGVLLIALFALQKSGVINLDWAWVQSGLESGVAWLKGEAGAMKDFILGYLPSSASALAGLVVGLRKG